MRTDLGDGIHKVRVAISSKNKGKSGGARIITDITAILSLEKGVITLLYIYDKSERGNISDKEIDELKKSHRIILINETKPCGVPVGLFVCFWRG